MDGRSDSGNIFTTLAVAAPLVALGVWLFAPPTRTAGPAKTVGGPGDAAHVAARWDPKYRLRFSNDFPDSTFGLVHFPGLCGGMVATVLDYLNAGVAAPTTTSTPSTDSGLGEYIHGRQADSLFGTNGARFIAWLADPSDDSVADDTDDELRTLRATIDAGRPVPIGLVPAPWTLTATDAHQVLAIAYGTWQGHEYVQVWDPNYPNAQTVLTRQSDRSWRESGGSSKDRWRGFFVEGYEPKSPPGTAAFAVAALA